MLTCPAQTDWLTTTDRVPAVNAWMRGGKKLTWRPPNMDMTTFGAEWRAWFDAINASEDALGGFEVSGAGGNWLLVLCLVWWWDTLKAIPDRSDDDWKMHWKALHEAKKDLKEVLETMMAMPGGSM